MNLGYWRGYQCLSSKYIQLHIVFIGSGFIMKIYFKLEFSQFRFIFTKRQPRHLRNLFAKEFISQSKFKIYEQANKRGTIEVICRDFFYRV